MRGLALDDVDAFRACGAHYPSCEGGLKGGLKGMLKGGLQGGLQGRASRGASRGVQGGFKGSFKGALKLLPKEAPTPSPKIISISGAKTNPKLTVPACHDSLSLSVLLMKEAPWFLKRAIEARRGVAEARLGRKNDWHKDNGDSKPYKYYC